MNSLFKRQSLKKVSHNLVTNKKDNYSVEIASIWQVKYSEDDRVAVVQIEGGQAPDNPEAVVWSLYKSTLEGWKKPHHLDIMGWEKKDEIISRISACLHLLELPHEIE